MKFYEKFNEILATKWKKFVEKFVENVEMPHKFIVNVCEIFK